jgi:RluA family pseudouridine synthase
MVEILSPNGQILDILWQDESIIAINKPSGMLCISDGYHAELPNLAGILKTTLGQIWIVHRLDKDTSGVILFARTAEIHRALSMQFADRKITKIYHAIIIGTPPWEMIQVNLPLRINGDREHRTIVDSKNGKPASTGFRVVGTISGYSLIEAIPHSGYTHQIRAHLSSIGLPLAGDKLYRQIGSKNKTRSEGSPIARLGLHAFQLIFTHPKNGQEVSIPAPYPLDFEKAAILFTH